MTDPTFRREEPPALAEHEVVEEKPQFPFINMKGRPKGSWNSDPNAISDARRLAFGVTLDLQHRRRFQWICKYFQLDSNKKGILFCINMVFELMIAHEKGFDLYMERKIGGTVYRRRIIIE